MLGYHLDLMEGHPKSNASSRSAGSPMMRLAMFACALVILGACGGSTEPANVEPSNVEPSNIEVPGEATEAAPALAPTDVESIAEANEVIAQLYASSPMEWAVENQELITTAVTSKDVAVCSDLDAQQDSVFNSPEEDGERYSDTFADAAVELPLVTLAIREGSRIPEYVMDSCLSDSVLSDAELANLAAYFGYWEGVANGEPALAADTLNLPTVDESQADLVEEFVSVTGSEVGFYAARQEETLAALTTLDADGCTLLRIFYNTTTPAGEISIGREAALALTESNPTVAANFEAQLEFHEQLYIRCQLATVSIEEVAFVTAVLDYWNGN